MATITGSYFDVGGTNVQLGPRLNSDREADFFALADDDSRAAKIYKQRPSGREAKLRAMIENAPPDAMLYSPHSAMCWPERLLYGAHQEFCGFIAPRFEPSTSSPLLYFCDPASRRKISARTTWRSLLRIAINLCGVMEAVHSQGHVIGDLNERNLFVSENVWVTLVDCESIQVQDNATGRQHKTALGNMALTPPELQGMSGEIRRETNDDLFMLAVVIFMLLMEGTHPFEGTWIGDGMPPTMEENIKQGRYSYARWGYLAPPEGAPPAEVLPPAIGKIFERCFINGLRHPDQRPSAADWRYELQQVDCQIETCGSNPHHLYSAHLDRCPWCAYAAERRRGTSSASAHRQVFLTTGADPVTNQSTVASLNETPVVESPSRFRFRWRRSAH
jgi:DNA-binding helix-hairpin-helix protein with protein kinase domain